MFHWVDYVVFVTAIIISLAIGIYHAGCSCLNKKKQTTVSEYLVGGRNLRPFPVGVSMTVSYISSIAVLGSSSEIHYYGVTFAFYLVGICFGALAAIVSAIPLFHPLQLTSITQVNHISL